MRSEISNTGLTLCRFSIQFIATCLLMAICLTIIPSQADNQNNAAQPRPEQHSLPLLLNFNRDAALAAKQCTPIIIMLSQAGCPYCRMLRQKIFEPMLISGNYQHTAILRELLIDQGNSLIDRQQKVVEASTFAKRYNSLGVTPTVIFLGPEGQVLGKPILGISNIDYYGYYLDRAIEQAAELLKPSCSH